MINKTEGIDYSKDVNGFLCGRFQPLHFGHFEFIEAALERTNKLYIGITNPFFEAIEAINYQSSDRGRGRPESNIFSFKERKRMIDSLMDRYFGQKEYEVLECDLNQFNQIVKGLPDNTILMTTIYDIWGKEKLNLFKNSKRPTEVLWNRDKKITNAGHVRHHLMNGKEWKTYVPMSTQKIIDDIGLDNIINRKKMPFNGNLR